MGKGNIGANTPIDQNQWEITVQNQPTTVEGKKEASKNKVKAAVALFFSVVAVVAVTALVTFLTAGAVIPLAVGIAAGLSSLIAIPAFFSISANVDNKAFEFENGLKERSVEELD